MAAIYTHYFLGYFFTALAIANIPQCRWQMNKI